MSAKKVWRKVERGGNLQPERGRAKRYQTRQLIGIVRDHGLQLDE